MKKYLFILTLFMLFTQVHVVHAAKVNIFQKYDKIIWIDQENQVGAAYGRGRKLLEFPVMTGDDETRTPPGTYIVKKKDKNYYSRKYDTPMPYSLFFDYRGRAIHEGDVADPEERSEWATHGCIHVEQPYMTWLYNWAEQGKTVVAVRGHRVWEEEEKAPTEEVGAGEDREGDQENVAGKDREEDQESGEAEANEEPGNE
jgi:hypothetical protein